MHRRLHGDGRAGRQSQSRERVDRQGRPEPVAGQASARSRRGDEPGRPPAGRREGKTSGGRHPVSPWGQPTKGYKTRNNKTSDRFIVQRRSGKARGFDEGSDEVRRRFQQSTKVPAGPGRCERGGQSLTKVDDGGTSGEPFEPPPERVGTHRGNPRENPGQNLRGVPMSRSLKKGPLSKGRCSRRSRP